MTFVTGKIRTPGGPVPEYIRFEAQIDGPAPPGPPPDPPYWKTPGYVSQQIVANVYAHYVDKDGKQCVPGPPGSGAIDIDYYTNVVIATGGWINPNPDTGENNSGYWTDKIGADLIAHGYRHK